MRTEISESEVEKLKRSFKRCGPETVEAIVTFRQTGDPAVIPAIVRGVVRRYLREEAKEFFETASPETPLASLGLDSLTMLETMLDVQEALNITIDDTELKRLRSIADLHALLAEKTVRLAEPT